VVKHVALSTFEAAITNKYLQSHKHCKQASNVEDSIDQSERTCKTCQHESI